MKIASWNVNGLRSVHGKDFLKWAEIHSPDVICLQEIKVQREQVEKELLNPLGYHSFWHSAEKKGYSGTLIYSKQEPRAVEYGLGDAETDREGRVLIAEYPEVTVLNAYFPNSQREHGRLPFKLSFCEKMFARLETLRAQGRQLILCGDFNIAHREIDLKNPKENQKNAGFLPQERAWMDTVTEKGYLDAFRLFNQEPGHYTWWSYRPTIRDRNIGWRLDYFLANPEFRDRIQAVSHQIEVRGSDHCPIMLELKK